MKRFVVVIAFFFASISSVHAGPSSEAGLSAAVAGARRDLVLVASGLESGLRNNDVKVAENLYSLEMKVTALLRKSGEVRFSSALAKADTQSALRATLEDVLTLQERVLDHTLAELDRVLPGEPERQLWSRGGKDLYRPLFRSDTPKPGQAPASSKEVLRGMQQDFAQSGGKPSQIRYLGKRTLAKLPNAQLIEWVQIGERFRVTAAGAKHPVIALRGSEVAGDAGEGHSVRGAGSMMIHRDSSGEVVAVIISSSSGNYKPSVAATMALSAKLTSLGIPTQNVIVTRNLPGEPVLVKLLMKSKKSFSKEQIKEHIAALEARARALVTTPAKTAPPVAALKASSNRSVKPRARATSAERHRGQTTAKARRTTARARR